MGFVLMVLVVVIVEKLVNDCDVAVVALRPEVSKCERIVKLHVPQTKVVSFHESLARCAYLCSVVMQYHFATTQISVGA